MKRLLAVCALSALTGCSFFQPQPSTAAGAQAPQSQEAGQSGPAESPQPPAQPGAQTYSLTLHNECPNTVKLAVGNTHTTLCSNTQTSYSGFVTDTIVIEDESEHQLSVYSPHAGQQEMKILNSCTGFAPY